jgi:hypothetical protein
LRQSFGAWRDDDSAELDAFLKEIRRDRQSMRGEPGT